MGFGWRCWKLAEIGSQQVSISWWTTTQLCETSPVQRWWGWMRWLVPPEKYCQLQEPVCTSEPFQWRSPLWDTQHLNLNTRSRWSWKLRSTSSQLWEPRVYYTSSSTSVRCWVWAASKPVDSNIFLPVHAHVVVGSHLSWSADMRRENASSTPHLRDTRESPARGAIRHNLEFHRQARVWLAVRWCDALSPLKLLWQFSLWYVRLHIRPNLHYSFLTYCCQRNCQLQLNADPFWSLFWNIHRTPA